MNGTLPQGNGNTASHPLRPHRANRVTPLTRKCFQPTETGWCIFPSPSSTDSDELPQARRLQLLQVHLQGLIHCRHVRTFRITYTHCLPAPILTCPHSMLVSFTRWTTGKCTRKSTGAFFRTRTRGSAKTSSSELPPAHPSLSIDADAVYFCIFISCSGDSSSHRRPPFECRHCSIIHDARVLRSYNCICCDVVRDVYHGKQCA